MSDCKVCTIHHYVEEWLSESKIMSKSYVLREDCKQCRADISGLLELHLIPMRDSLEFLRRLGWWGMGILSTGMAGVFVHYMMGKL